MENKATMQRQRQRVLLLSITLALSACGGGGGNTRPTPPPTTPTSPPAPPPSVPQPAIDAHLTLTHADAAQAAGFNGSGVIIGMVDTGINADQPAVKGRVIKQLIYVDPAKNDTSKGDVVGHGTWTAMLAAGKPFGQWPGGIAPGASLVSARIISDTPPKDDGSGQGNKVEPSDADFFGKTLLPDLISNNVQVMNNSWGGLYFDPTNAKEVGQAFGAAFRSFVIDHDGLVIFATGNADPGGPQPTDTAAIPYYAPDLERGWLAVAAIDPNKPTELTPYSNACGKAMHYCLVAPGNVIVPDAHATGLPTDYFFVQGTSFSTPLVAGAAALVKQAYPYFNNDLVRQTLLTTAKDLGAPGIDPVFGYGLLDAGKAVQGPARFDFGDVTVNFSGRSTWGNAIAGAGGLVKQGDGVLTLSQLSSFAGLTDVQNGGLIADALAGDVRIGASGELVANSVAGSITNAGSLDVGDTGGATVAGNYTQQAGGQLALSLGSSLKVTGKAALDGALYVYGANSGYTVNSHTDVVTAGGGLSGRFATLDHPSTVLLTASVNYDANSAWLDVSQVNVTSVAGSGAAAYGAAERVQGAFEQLNLQVSGGAPPAASSSFVQGATSLQQSTSRGAVQQSLQSLSGQLHAASAAMTFEAIDAGTRALSDRFDTLLDAPQTGAPTISTWAQDLGYHGSMARGGYSNVGVDLSGWMSGADRRLGSHGVVGYALSQSQGLGRLAESADQGRSHAMEAMLYGGTIRGAWYTMGRFGVGHHREDMRRRLQLGDQISAVSSRTDGDYSVAYGESGYRFALGQTQITPYVNLQFARIQRDGFDEVGGGGFGLKAGSQQVRRWQGGLGIRSSRGWNLRVGGQLELQTHLLWQQSLATSGDVFQASFTGLQQWAPVGGIGLSRYGGVAGAALAWSTSPRNRLAFGVDQYLGQREHSQMATLSYRLSF